MKPAKWTCKRKSGDFVDGTLNQVQVLEPWKPVEHLERRHGGVFESNLLELGKLWANDATRRVLLAISIELSSESPFGTTSKRGSLYS